MSTSTHTDPRRVIIGRIGIATRMGRADEALAARRELTAVNLREQIHQALDGPTALRDEDRLRLAAMLLAGVLR